MIAEIVSLSGYESQIAALLTEEERMAMEFFIASAPEDHPVVYFFLAEPGRIYMAAVYAKSRQGTLSAANQTCSRNSRRR